MTKGRQNTDSSTARKKHGEKELVNGFLLTCLESILEKCSSVTKVIQKGIPQLRGSRGKELLNKMVHISGLLRKQ